MYRNDNFEEKKKGNLFMFTVKFIKVSQRFDVNSNNFQVTFHFLL